MIFSNKTHYIINLCKFNKYINNLKLHIIAIIERSVIYKNNRAVKTPFSISPYISTYLYKDDKKNNYIVTTNKIPVLNSIYI